MTRQNAPERVRMSTPDGRVYGEYLLNRIVVDAWQCALGSLDIDREEASQVPSPVTRDVACTAQARGVRTGVPATRFANTVDTVDNQSLE